MSAATQVRNEQAAPYLPALISETAILEQARAILDRRIRRDPFRITSPDTALEYLQLRVGHLEHEVFGVIWLDNRHGVIDVGELFRGTIDGAHVAPREVLKEAMRLNAMAAVFYHNHPSGDPTPSEADRRLTTKLQELFRLVDMRVLDHFVIGAGETYSMAEHGLL